MTTLEMLGIFAAGMGAGCINTVVGSGSLITFPVLVAFGYPPVVANVSNTVGIVFGSITGAVGYRREMAGQRRRLVLLSVVSAVGAFVGGVLLLRLPAEAFQFIVPILILIAVALIITQPWLNKWMRRRAAARAGSPTHDVGPFLLAGVLCSGVYGGYFGAAQGVILIGLLGLFINESLQRINAAKNVAAAVVNAVAALLFVFVAPVAWGAVALLAGGSIIGGVLGSIIGRRLPPFALRLVVIVVGVYAAAQMLV